MRPLNLKISAFGPYSNICEIDLQSLGNRGLYLITGDTGAGKSTMFDAISFALFGEPSGQSRESSQFRSKYADDDTPTFVELSFEYNNQIYYIKRNPSYLRKSKRGEGFATQGADAELRTPDGEIFTKINQVNVAICELLGINRDQFSQIVMLAQGDFARLLTASTDERKEIFRHIFKTANFNSLQNELKARTSAVRDVFEQKTNSISQYFCDVFCDAESPYADKLEMIHKNQLTFSESIEIISAIIDADNADYNKLSDDFSKLEHEISQINIILAENQKNIDAKIKLDDTSKQLSNAETLLFDSTEKLKICEQNKPEIQKLSALIVTKTNLLENYDQLDAQVLTYQRNKKQLELQAENIKNYTAKKDKLSADLLVEKSALVPRETLIAESNSLIHRLSDLTREKSEFQAFKSALFNLEIQQKNLAEIQQNYIAISQKTDQFLCQHKTQNKLFLDCQAGILADQLLPDIPCLVCGSKTHPNKAVKPLSAPSKEQVDQLFEQYNSALAKSSEISQNASILKGKCDQMLDEINKSAQDFHISTDFSNFSIEIDAKILENTQNTADISSKHHAMQDNLNLLAKIADELPQKEQQLADLISEIGDLQVAHASLCENQDGVIALSKKLRENLDFDSKTLAIQDIRKITNNRDLLQSEIDSLTTIFNQQKSQFDALFATKNTITDQLKNTTIVDVTDKTNLLHSLNADKTVLSSTLKTVYSRISSNQKALHNLNTQKVEIDKVESELTMISTLSKTANGNLAGKEKIALETYVQMFYFDRVLIRANTRFMAMTDDKYKLVRKIGSDKNNRQSGLDIDVFDYYNGSTRSIKTLSGGESFKASLALALGLSDEIMSTAGGIKIDTMFVDEGFGSLDEQSLNSAIKVLSDLCKGNRLVGIISHVSELKDRVDNQIIVKKNPNGCSDISIKI